jgi:hypothetical protein
MTAVSAWRAGLAAPETRKEKNGRVSGLAATFPVGFVLAHLGLFFMPFNTDSEYCTAGAVIGR